MTSTDPEFDAPGLPAPLQAAVGRLDAWCQAALKAQEDKDRVEAPLYHYTSTAGLKAILDSQQLWFTDYRHLNDPKELRYGIEQAHEALRLAQVDADGRVGLFLRFTADLLSLENLDTLAFFVGSFTRARDDLGQWRAYADDGRGVAIGFAHAMFAVGAAVSPDANENAFVGSVLYDTSAILARHRAAIDAAAAIFQETADANVEVLRDKAVGIPFMRQLSLRLIASALIWNALTSKHRGYAGEQEVRLVTMGTADALATVTQTRIRGREIVPYTQHPWPTKGAGQIVEIVVGPSAPPDTEPGIKTMLEGSRIVGVPVVRSDIPYRAG